MRRTDHASHAARQDPPPFRVLAMHDASHLSPSFAAMPPKTPPPPPPPRAPEPYKIAPPTVSFGSRAHRRSSFVILAESRPASPEPGDADTSALSAGRVSPFRGRGFKGPPPRSMSRPQSPDVAADGRRRGKVQRRGSVSQQNSPRRSLIPQPTYRQRSSSLTKANDDSSPPAKIGRRVDSTTRLNRSDSRTRLSRSNSNSRVSLAEPRARFISNSTSNINKAATAAAAAAAATARRQPTKASTRLSPIQGTPTKPEKTTTGRPARGESRAKETSKPSLAKATSRTSPRKGGNVVDAGRRNDRSNASRDRVTSPSKIPLKASKNGGGGGGGGALGSSNPSRFITMPEQSAEQRRSPRRSQDRKPGENGGAGCTESNGDAGQDAGRSTPLPNGRSSFGDANGYHAVNGGKDDVDLMGLLKQSSSHAPAAIGSSGERLVNTTATTAVQPLHIDASTSTAVSPAPKDEPASSSSPLPAPDAASRASQRSESQPTSRPASYNPGGDKRDSSSSVDPAARNVAAAGRTNGATQARNQSSAGQKNGQSSRGSKPDEPDANSAATATATAAAIEVAPTGDRMPTVTENEPRTAEAVQGKPGAVEAKAKATNVDGNDGNTNARGGETASARSARARNENRGSDASLKSSAGVSTNSVESVRSTDTGVSVNTVRGVSSPREKTGMHVEKRSQEIETLSGNVMRVEQNGEPAVLAGNNEKQSDSRRPWARWGKSLNRYTKCCPGMRCLACRRDPKGLLWTRNQERPTLISEGSPPPVATVDAQTPPPSQPKTNMPSRWAKLKTRCRCARLREIKCCKLRRARIAPAESTTCCPPERRFGALCRRVFSRCSCKRNADTQQRTRNVRAKHSLTSVAPPPLSEEPKAKLPDVLVEHNSVMRGAIPCLPVPLAWFCLVWNVLLPGTGTVWSGLFNLCTGQPRFSSTAGLKSRLGAFIVDLVVGVGQMFTVLFCLVGWGWSIWWGVTMVRLARKYKRVRDSAAASNDPEARGGDPAVPSQALRGVERAR